ncbi:MAG: 2-amino-4-hydroxy-6-hydroxymethyldihydropteridine diphosphokinase [bacterium]
MTTRTAYIGIGSNLGDRQKNCTAAIDLLAHYRDIKVSDLSDWYETKALPTAGWTLPQPDYVNGVARIETPLPPAELLSRLLEVESRLGRPMERQKGEPRTVDLDLLLYGDMIIDEPGLSVPHPELAKRLFVLVPLCDIAPDAVDPRSGLSAAEMRELLSTDTEANR